MLDLYDLMWAADDFLENPTLENFGYVVLSVAFLAAPFLTGAGSVDNVAKEVKQADTLFDYTDDVGLDAILSSKKLNPSLKAVNPKDARYGNGQYLSDFLPGTKTPGQLSREFISNPFKGRKYTNYIEIDVSGLNVIKGRNGVYVIPNEVPLDISRRIVSYGSITR